MDGMMMSFISWPPGSAFLMFDLLGNMGAKVSPAKTIHHNMF